MHRRAYGPSGEGEVAFENGASVIGVAGPGVARAKQQPRRGQADEGQGIGGDGEDQRLDAVAKRRQVPPRRPLRQGQETSQTVAFTVVPTVMER